MGTFTVQRETFEGENLRKSRGFVAIRESFLREIWGMPLFGGTSEQSTKVFSAKILFSTNLRKFSPTKVSHYQYMVVRWQALFIQQVKALQMQCLFVQLH